MGRLAAIGFVWLGCAIAWAALGSSLVVRSDTSMTRLGSEVEGLWGAELVQFPPRAFFETEKLVKESRTVIRDDGEPVETTITKKVKAEQDIELASSEIDADFKLEHRRRGLMWFPTYEVAFAGAYRFKNDDTSERTVTIQFPIEAHGRTYDNFVVQRAEGIGQA